MDKNNNHKHNNIKENRQNLRKFVCPELVFGHGARQLAGQYAANLALKKVLLVTDSNINKAGWIDEIISSLESFAIDSSVYAEVEENSPIESIKKGVGQLKNEGCNGIIALGGGSVIDCAKVISVVSHKDTDVEEIQGVDKIDLPGPPLICIPTTCGSSADVSQFAIVLNRAKKVKMALVSKKLVPETSLIDPMTISTLPAYFRYFSAVDALSHAIEAYVSNASSKLTDLHALSAIRRVSNILYREDFSKNDIDVFSELMLASLEAGMAFSNASLGLAHAFSHAIGGVSDEHHGYINAVVLPEVINFNFDSVPGRYRKILESIDPKAKETPDNKIKQMLFLRLSEILKEDKKKLSISRVHKDLLVRSTLNDVCIVTNPRWPNENEVDEIYERILQ